MKDTEQHFPVVLFGIFRHHFSLQKTLKLFCNKVTKLFQANQKHELRQELEGRGTQISQEINDKGHFTYLCHCYRTFSSEYVII